MLQQNYTVDWTSGTGKLLVTGTNKHQVHRGVHIYKLLTRVKLHNLSYNGTVEGIFVPLAADEYLQYFTYICGEEVYRNTI